MKLELKHLAPYLPYGLKIYMEDLRSHVKPFSWELGIETNLKQVLDFQNKPILRPLSDLKIVGSDIINEHSINILISEKHNIDYGIFSHFKGHLDLELDGDHMLRYDADKSISFQVFFDIQNELLKGHYDVFGLIEERLAIDINKFNKQPKPL